MTAFKDWYSANRERLNKARRSRYKKDLKYRKRCLANTKRWRRDRAKEQAKLPPPPKTSFTIGELVEQIGCDQKTIRNLEKAGLIPSTSDGVHHRRFNAKQVKLVREVVEFRKQHHYKDPKYQRDLNRISQRAHAQWGQ